MEVLHFYIEDGIGTYFWQDIDNWGNVVWGSIQAKFAKQHDFRKNLGKQHTDETIL